MVVQGLSIVVDRIVILDYYGVSFGEFWMYWMMKSNKMVYDRIFEGVETVLTINTSYLTKVQVIQIP